MLLRKRDIIVMGECLAELNLGGQHRVKCLGIGGDCLVVGAAAASLGSNVDLISAIAMDPFADFIREQCAKAKIDLTHTRSVEGYNGVYAVKPNDSEEREFAYYRPGCAASQITTQDVHEDHVKSAKIVHASSITQALSAATRKAVFKAFELCHLHEGMVSYDPNLRLRLWSMEDAKEAIWSVMPFIDVLFPSAPDESKALFGYERPIDVIGFLWDHGIHIVVVKNGAHGCMIGYDGKVEEIPSPPVNGSKHYTHVGSAFCGGFLHGIACGLDPFQSGRIAVEAAAIKLKHAGSLNSLAKAEDIQGLCPKSLKLETAEAER